MRKLWDELPIARAGREGFHWGPLLQSASHLHHLRLASRVSCPFPGSFMNIEQARFNMVEQQIRTWEVLAPSVLELLFLVKREEFVPPEHRSIAFADLEVPLGH